jgi:hypothetical protein
LCIPGIGPLDEAFTMIVAQSIERQEIGVRTEWWDALSISLGGHALSVAFQVGRFW